MNHFDFGQPPKAPQLPPAAPPATFRITVTGPGSASYTAPLGQTFRVDLSAETPGLNPDLALAGQVTLWVAGPPGAPAAKLPGAVACEAALAGSMPGCRPTVTGGSRR